MKFFNLLIVACFSLGGGLLNPFEVNAGYRNSAGGNVYGNSDLNWKVDPNLNWKADPDLNPMGMSDDEF